MSISTWYNVAGGTLYIHCPVENCSKNIHVDVNSLSDGPERDEAIVEIESRLEQHLGSGTHGKISWGAAKEMSVSSKITAWDDDGQQELLLRHCRVPARRERSRSPPAPMTRLNAVKKLLRNMTTDMLLNCKAFIDAELKMRAGDPPRPRHNGAAASKSQGGLFS